MHVRAPLPKPRAAARTAATASARTGGSRAAAVAAATASSSAGCRQSAATASTSTAAWAAAVRGAAVCSSAVVAAVRAGAAAVRAATAAAAAARAASVDALAAAASLEDAVAGVRRARRARPGPPVAAVRRPPVTRAADAGLSARLWLDVVPLKNNKAKFCQKLLAYCNTLDNPSKEAKPVQSSYLSLCAISNTAEAHTCSYGDQRICLVCGFEPKRNP